VYKLQFFTFMEFNVDKCKVIHVENTDSSSSFYMEGSELTEVSYEKDLGVWVSSDMKCSKQCVYAFNKATRVLGMIKSTIRFKDTRDKLLGVPQGSVFLSNPCCS